MWRTFTQMRMRIFPTMETAFGYWLWNIWTLHAQKKSSWTSRTLIEFPPCGFSCMVEVICCCQRCQAMIGPFKAESMSQIYLKQRCTLVQIMYEAELLRTLCMKSVLVCTRYIAVILIAYAYGDISKCKQM